FAGRTVSVKFKARPLAVESTPTLRNLFEEVLGLSAAEREWLYAARGVDAETRAQIESMLAADATEDELLRAGDAATAARAIGDEEPASALPAGSRIGPFEIVEVLGEGGSSTVFRAFREHAGVRQDVAVKLLARGLYTPEAQRQFRREREALARLRHRAIARLIEGGIADNGLAYIALELVDGSPITRHARQRHLSERERLVLFLEVCRAVEAAHRALIVHRDLKPSNVLVTAEGEVKLLDFGIAKLLDYADDATRTLHQALTPAYAAPEQFDTGAITTATDVYALGVLLGELLTGEVRPRYPDTWTGADAAVRNAPGNGLARKLRGDLANIVGKATATEPENRYAFAGALAEDIERYLDGRPVLAHPPSRWYRTEKFIARHRGGVMITTALLLAIFVSLGAALWQAQVAREQAQVAQQQAARANMVRDFVESLFAPIRYGTAASHQPSLSDLLARGVGKLEHSPQLGAGERVDLLAMFSRLYENLGDIERSRKLADQAVALSQHALSPSDINAIRALTARGYAEVRSEDYAHGGADLRLAHQRMLAQNIHGETLIDLLEPLAVVENIEGHGEAALRLTREALAERIATWGPDDPRVGIGYNDIASELEGLERYEEAIRMWQKTWRFQLSHVGQDSGETTLALAGWASSEYRAGHWTRAHELFARALAMYARIGREPQITQVYAAQKACVLDGLRVDRTSALANCKLARTLSSTGFGATSALHGDSLEAGAFGDVEAGDLAAAQREYEQARKLYGDDPANRMRVGRVDSELAGIALLEGKPAVARDLLPAAIAGLRTRAYKVPPLVAEARLLLACAQAPGPQCPRDLQTRVDHDLAEVASRDDPLLLWVHTLLARVELLHGQPAQARARLTQAIQRASAELQPTHPRRIVAQLWLAVADARMGDCTAANAQVRAARAVIAGNHLAAHPVLAPARAALSQPISTCGVLFN
ncbi:MAG TPA: serine/threonine-protein kinase, partial [Rhodanobacteraceae bacterium]|nr:serine/threonine-protein kinase [Rhodanobacteraceae bacterium]